MAETLKTRTGEARTSGDKPAPTFQDFSYGSRDDFLIAKLTGEAQ